MTNYTLDVADLLPHLGRMSVGFDRLFNDVRTFSAGQQTGYPPYNVIKNSDTEYTVEIAVAGFQEDELSITQDNNQLVVCGVCRKDAKDETLYMHKGISNRDFTRSWTVADHVEVKSAELVNGLLVIHLEHIIPEELKPKQIAISSNTKKLK